MKISILFLISYSFVGCLSISQAQSNSQPYQPCSSDLVRLEARTKELASIVKADQDDRQDWNHKKPEEIQPKFP